MLKKILKFKGNSKPYLCRLFVAVFVFIFSLFVIKNGNFELSYIFSLKFLPNLVKLSAQFTIFSLCVVLFHIIIAFFFGRFYCSTFCLFGLLQDFAGSIFKFVFKRKPENIPNLYALRYFMLSIVLSAFVFKIPSLVKFLDPYSNSANIFINLFNIKTAQPAAFIPLFIILVLVFSKNRIFCTSLCPVGTIFGLFSKKGFYGIQMNENCKSCGICEKNCPTGAIDSKSKTVNNEICTRCLRCLAACPSRAIKFDRVQKEETFSPERRKFLTVSSVAVLGIAAGAAFSKMLKSAYSNLKSLIILPAGAKNLENFSSKCTNCNLCTNICRGKIIKKADDKIPSVHIDYDSGYCHFDCNDCAKICPAGAIQNISLEEKQKTRIALCVFNKEVCVGCSHCVRSCPTGAFSGKHGEKPSFDASKCIGCGLCASVCPVKAISMSPILVQTKIN